MDRRASRVERADDMTTDSQPPVPTGGSAADQARYLQQQTQTQQQTQRPKVVPQVAEVFDPNIAALATAQKEVQAVMGVIEAARASQEGVSSGDGIAPEETMSTLDAMLYTATNVRQARCQSPSKRRTPYQESAEAVEAGLKRLRVDAGAQQMNEHGGRTLEFRPATTKPGVRSVRFARLLQSRRRAQSLPDVRALNMPVHVLELEYAAKKEANGRRQSSEWRQIMAYQSMRAQWAAEATNRLRRERAKRLDAAFYAAYKRKRDSRLRQAQAQLSGPYPRQDENGEWYCMNWLSRQGLDGEAINSTRFQYQVLAVDPRASYALPRPVPIGTPAATPAAAAAESLSSQAQLRALRKHEPLIPPPISMSSLRELEWKEIQENPQVRHDVVHDAEITFRPNVSGDRVEQKRRETDSYWRSIARELERLPYLDAYHRRHTRLYLVFRELRDILASIVPADERPLIHRAIDIELDLQLLHYGTFQSADFGRWICEQLRRFCAPNRDGHLRSVLKYAELCETEPRNMAEMLRRIFDVLEIIKLDSANYHMQSLRPQLLPTAVEFQQRYYEVRFVAKTLSRTEAYAWLHMHNHEPIDLVPAFAFRFSKLLLGYQSRRDVPSSLLFDHTRIAGLARECRRLLHYQVALLLAKNLCKGDRAKVASIADDLRVLIIPEELDYVSKPVPKDPLTQRVDRTDRANEQRAMRVWEQRTAIRNDAIAAIATQIAVKAQALPAEGESELECVSDGGGEGGAKADEDTIVLPASAETAPAIAFATNWLAKQLDPLTGVHKMLSDRLLTLLAHRSGRVLHEGTRRHNGVACASLVLMQPDERDVMHDERAATLLFADVKHELDNLVLGIVNIGTFHLQVHGPGYIAHAEEVHAANRARHAAAAAVHADYAKKAAERDGMQQQQQQP